MLHIVQSQLATDLNCTPDDFYRDGFVYCDAKENPGRRPFPRGECHFEMYTMGSAITEKEYSVGGGTALLDAIGRTIHKIGNAQRHTHDDYRAEKVLFVIITDGEENASREYSSDKVKAQIERQKSRYGWEFIFLGANIDAVETAQRFGIAPDRAQSYHSDSEGTNLNYRIVAEATVAFRESGALPQLWNKEIDADFKRRGGRK
jgi:hypothetical protein